MAFGEIIFSIIIFIIAITALVIAIVVLRRPPGTSTVTKTHFSASAQAGYIANPGNNQVPISVIITNTGGFTVNQGVVTLPVKGVYEYAIYGQIPTSIVGPVYVHTQFISLPQGNIALQTLAQQFGNLIATPVTRFESSAGTQVAPYMFVSGTVNVPVTRFVFSITLIEAT
jgi:hypothetical protein